MVDCTRSCGMTKILPSPVLSILVGFLRWSNLGIECLGRVQNVWQLAGHLKVQTWPKSWKKVVTMCHLELKTPLCSIAHFSVSWTPWTICNRPRTGLADNLKAQFHKCHEDDRNFGAVAGRINSQNETSLRLNDPIQGIEINWSKREDNFMKIVKSIWRACIGF